MAAITAAVVPAPERLAHDYRPQGNYAGTTFTDLPPIEPNQITGADV
jgi:hypothetical protein